MATTPTTVNLPTGDFVTSTLNGALTSAATSGTIGSGLSIPSANGLLEIDYDSSLAIGVDSGPETILYTSYNSGTGALTGITRGVQGTTGVAHINGATVQAAPSIGYFNNLKDIIQLATFTDFSGTIAPTGYTGSPTINLARWFQIGKLVWCDVEFSGTSNSTSCGFVLPVAAKSNTNATGIARITDNGTGSATPGIINLTAASTTASVGITIAGGGSFTNSGTKAVQTHFFYEAN